MTKVSEDWFFDARGPEDKEKRRQVVMANTASLALLYKILEKKLASVERQKLSEDSYSSPAWPYFQADKNGQVRTLTELLRLIEFAK